MEGETRTYHGEMLPVIVTHIRDINELLHYIENCKEGYKIAPAYVLYSCALYCSEKIENKLQLFLERAAIMIHNQGINAESITAAVFYFANASELLYFFKNDTCLSKYSEEAQNILTASIRSIVHRLLAFFMKGLNRGINESDYFDKIIRGINATTTRLEHCYVNVAFINQLLSFLLQWICGKLIANNENASYYTELFKELEVYATTMDDSCLLLKVKEFYCLINNGTKNAENTNVVHRVKLKWQPPNVLTEYNKGKYNSFIEKAAKLLIQCNGGNIQPTGETTTLRLLIPCTGYSWQNEAGDMDCLNNMFSALHYSGLCRLSNKHKNSGKWDVRLKSQIVETFCLKNIQFQVQQGINNLEEGLHVIGCSSDISSLGVGDHILAVNGKTLIGITEGEAEAVTRTSLADDVQLDVIKIEACEVLLQTPTDVVPPGETTGQEIEIKFNLVESSSRNLNLNISQSVHGEQAQFFLDIIKEVEGLDNMLEEFCGISENDERYIYMKEIMMRNILRLDTMDMKNNQEIKKTKRDVIYFIQDRIARLKAKLSSNQERTKDSSEVKLDRNATNHDSGAVFTAKSNSAAAPSEDMDTCSNPSFKGSENASSNRQAPRQHQLICETKYSLNPAETKFVSTGIYPISEGIVPVIKFSSGSSHLFLGIEDWIALLRCEQLLREQIQNKLAVPLQTNFGRYNLRFQSNCVEITYANAFFNLDNECVHNLLQLSQLIICRINVMQDYCNQFQQAIAIIAQPPADPILELLQHANINPSISQLLNEYIHFYPDAIRKNVEMVQNRRGTTLSRVSYV